MSNHTKLPWAVHNGGHIQNEDIDVIVWGSGLAAKNRLNNSRFIVKACNNHYKLLDALKALRDGVKDDSPDVWEMVDQAIKDAS